MIKKTLFHALILIVAFACISPASAAPAAKLKVLLLTGKNNHNWQETTPIVLAALSETERFEIDVTEDPAADFTTENLKKYDVILSNWTNFPKKDREWGEAGEKAFLDFVRQGKGFALFHAASATFNDWPEFQQIIGSTWGKDTGHGKPHEFKVEPTDSSHPIMRGIPPFTIKDELWHRTAKQPGVQVLASAFSNVTNGGSGAVEPLALTTQFGKGRCFNLILGHDATAMNNPAWKTLMARGTEWAATGKVTIPIPDAISPEAQAKHTQALLAKIAKYTRQYRRADLMELDSIIQRAGNNANTLHDLSVQIMTTIEATGSTLDAKEQLLRRIALIGSPQNVPALASMLADEKLAASVRYTLQQIPGEEVDAALIKALNASKGLMQIGIINTLGDRRTKSAVKPLAALISSDNEDLAQAAIINLGKIATLEASDALLEAREKITHEANKTHADSALLYCAKALLENGEETKALDIQEQIAQNGATPQLRILALTTMAHLATNPTGLAGSAIANQDMALREAGIEILRGLLSPEQKEAIFLKLQEMPNENFPVQIYFQIISALPESVGKETCATLIKLLQSETEDVRIAAADKLGYSASPDAILPLAKMAATTKDTDQATARRALVRLNAPSINEEMAKMLGTEETAIISEIVQALRLRDASEVAPTILQSITKSQDSTYRREAIQTLGAIGNAKTANQLTELLDSTSDSSERRATENALVAIARRQENPGSLIQSFLAGDRSPDAQVSLLRVAGTLGGPQATEGMRNALKSTNADIRLAALRATATWPDASLLDDMAQAASKAQTDTERILALRGLVAQLGKATELDAEKKVALIAKALKNAKRPDEKNLLATALGATSHPNALPLLKPLLADKETQVEASLATIKIIEATGHTNKSQARTILRQIKANTADATIMAKVDDALLALSQPTNLAIGAIATSPDGLEKDGQASGDQAAIDGDPNTYWDEENGKNLYILKVDFPIATQVSAIRITGFQQHAYAPKTFDIVCDGKTVKTVRDAVYADNVLNVTFPATKCKTLELKITTYYAQSPAIRELEIFNMDEEEEKQVETPREFSWQKKNETLALLNGDKTVWQFNYKKDEGKPYFHPLGLTDGTDLTWLRPADHPWHRALWFSWKFINGLNYWEEDKTGKSEGESDIISVKTETRDDFSAHIVVTIYYHPPQKETLLIENRTIDISAPNADGNYSLDWISVFDAQQDNVELSRTPLPGEEGGKSFGGYAGYSLRMLPEMKQWEIIGSEGLKGVEGHGKNARWLLVRGKAKDDTPVSVAILDHTQNLRHPEPWYISPNITYISPAPLFNERLTMNKDETLNLRYRLLIMPGLTEPQQIEKEWQQYK